MKLFLLFIISISVYVQSNEMERFDLNYQNVCPPQRLPTTSGW